jgi:glycosyltransferase involved in cell wall biosynthesis
MRVILLIEHLGLHGGVRRCIELGNALVAAGHEVYIGTEKGEPCTWWPTLPWVYAWDKLPVSSCALALMFGMTSLMRATVERLGARHKAIYLVGVDEQRLEEIAVEKSNWLELVTGGEYHVLCCATWLWDWVRERLNPKAQLLLGGLNRTIFHPVKGARRPGELVLLNSGDNRGREGVACVRKAAEIIKDKYPAAKLTTYCKKGYPQSEMARVYASAALFLDGQWYAGWANAVIESMACGTPVVCTNIGGVKNFAIDGVSALLVPREDPQAMANAALRLLDDPGLYQLLVKGGLKYSAGFSYAETVRTLEGYIEGWSG